MIEEIIYKDILYERSQNDAKMKQDIKAKQQEEQKQFPYSDSQEWTNA